MPATSVANNKHNAPFTRAQRLGDAWKMLIKIWEKRYKENVFRAPTKEDKKSKVEWYEQYKACREVRSGEERKTN